MVRRRKAGVGEASIRNQLQTLRSALAQAVRWGWISQNPASLASYERPTRAVRDSMTLDDVLKVVAAAETGNEMAPAMLRLAAITGARRAELAALRWTDVEGAVLTIDSAITVDLESDTAAAPRPDNHDMRHWSATFAVTEGYDLATLAGRLGHSDPSTTLRVYAHARSQRDVELAASPGDALRQPTEEA